MEEVAYDKNSFNNELQIEGMANPIIEMKRKKKLNKDRIKADFNKMLKI